MQSPPPPSPGTDSVAISSAGDTVAALDAAASSPDSCWVFGYGSLVWRPGDLPFRRKIWGHINGWKRRFWQGSTDHRGVPGSPGRVVTLIREEGAQTWGVAYEVPLKDWPQAVAYLDYREKGGYARHDVIVTPQEPSPSLPSPLHAVIYIADETNANYLGDAPVTHIAQTICFSKGPSGPNIEYLMQLAGALRANGIHDPHVVEIEAATTEILSQAASPSPNR